MIDMKMSWVTDDLQDRLQGSTQRADKWIWIFGLHSLQNVGIYVHRVKIYCMNNSLKNIRLKSLVLCHCSCYLASLGLLFAAGQQLCRTCEDEGACVS